MKKLLKVVLCLSAMLFSLTSCNGMHNRLYSNDQSIADDTMNDIIKYVNDEDINSLSQMFSKKALSSIDKYENKLKVFLAKLRCGIKNMNFLLVQRVLEVPIMVISLNQLMWATKYKQTTIIYIT